MQLSDYEYDLIGRRFQAKSANEINYVEFDYVLRHYSGDHEPVWAATIVTQALWYVRCLIKHI